MRIEWDFSRLPDKEHANVLDLLARGRWWELVAIHDKYQLSDNNYCCSNTLSGIKQWFTYGVETGQIRPAAEEGNEAEQSQAPSV